MRSHMFRANLVIKLIYVLFITFSLCFVYYWFLENKELISGLTHKKSKGRVNIYSSGSDSPQMNTVSQSNSMHGIVEEAHKVSLFNKTVLVTLVNDAFIPFAFSWLCNTQSMNIHGAILVVTTSEAAMTKLKKIWPNIHVIYMELDLSSDKQAYSTAGYVKIMIRRAELFQALLDTGLEIMLFEFDYVWFKNPVPRLQKTNDVDMLVNPVSNTNDKIVNGGFIYLFPTHRTKTLWKELTNKLVALGKSMQNKTQGASISESTNDQTFLSRLVRSRYANIKTRVLPLDTYADGKWYSASQAMRGMWKPDVISNNWIIGIDNKIKRAKQFGHWFLRDDGTCDTELVHNVTTKNT